MKKLNYVGVLFLLILPAMLFANGAAESTAKTAEGSEAKKPEMILRYSEVNSINDERALAAQQFADIIKEKTAGRIEIQVFPGAQLGDNKTVVQSLQFGSIDMCNEPPTNLKNLGVNVPYLDVFSLPFLFRDEAHAIKVMDGEVGQKLIDDINNSGSKLIVLDHFVAGARNFFTKVPCTSLDEFKSLKIRVQQSAIYMDTVKAFGGSPTPTSTAELYSALQTGVVDGAEQPVKGYFNSKYYEVAKYYTVSNYMIQPSSIMISEKTWNKLSDSDKVLFKETAKTVTQNFQRDTDAKLDGQLAQLKAEGVVFGELRDYDKWVAAVAPIYEKYGAGYQDLINQIKSVK